MFQHSEPYVSVFKIDGKPILPPVIDDNRRIEINRDRQLAIEVERRLRLNRKHRDSVTELDSATSEIDETLVKGAVECSASNYDTSAAVDSLLDDNTSTLKEYATDETKETIENTSTVDKFTVKEWQSDDEKNVVVEQKAPNVASLSLIIDSNINPFHTESISPSFSLHSSPSLGALNDSRNQSLYFTPMSGRDSFSSMPSGSLPATRLIRSNSYTLEKPSPLLLKHMAANGDHIGLISSPLKSPMSFHEFKESSNNVLKKHSQPFKSNVMREQTPKNNNTTKISLNKSANKSLSLVSSNSSLNSTTVASNSTKSPHSVKLIKNQKLTAKQKQIAANKSGEGIFKNKESVLRSIYGTGKPNKTKLNAKNSNVSVASSDCSGKTPTNPEMKKKSQKPCQDIEMNLTRSSNGNINTQNYQDILAMIEQQHSAQMLALIQRQQDEQKRMQQEFQRQQEELLKKISNLMESKQSTPKENELMMTEAKKSNGKMLIEEVNTEIRSTIDTNGNRINRFTPESSKCIRRLYYDDNKLIANDLNKTYSSSLSLGSSEPTEEYNENVIAAVNVLAAHIRGYLTRRLFKTAKVQNIVKTIRDTLLFILQLHYETQTRAQMGEFLAESETEADIELKAHLIQQLASSSQNLHDIFIEIPIAERMNIIAKDREWQQFKLKRSKSSNNNKNHMFVNGNSQSARFENKF